jgi:hypothetical protein
MELPQEVKEAVVYTAKNWPKTLTSVTLLKELNALATRVYILAVTQGVK